MKGRRYLITALLFSAVIALSGCGEAFPEMTEEEYNQTVEFAVGLLMKYSNNDQSKLTYVNAKEEQKAREKAARKEAEKTKDSTKTTTTQTTQTPTQTTTPSTTQTTQTKDTDNDESVLLNDGSRTDASDDLSSLDSTVGGEKDNSETVESTAENHSDVSEPEKADNDITTVTTNPNAMVMSSDESMEVMDGIYLSYQGYSVSSTYPESSKSYVINADKGKRLLVLRFDLYNGTDSGKKVNLIDKNILIQVILNGKNLGYTAVTFLPNDLTSYVGTIDSRAHESLVVLTEIDESASTSIQTLGMKVSISGIERDVTLK